MADTEFSGELMGLNGACFNPHYSYKTSFVTNDVFPVPSDRGLVDYLVHGKRTMIQTYNPTIGDLPYVEKKEKEPVKVILNPKWYDAKKWNEIETAHRVPATCSFPHIPEYEIIHTAPYHSKEVFQGPSMPTPTGIEFPDSMIETVPVTYTMVTSKVVSEIEEFQGEAYVYPKAQSPFYGLKGMDLINAKLDFIGADKDWDEEEEEGEDWKPYIDAEDYTTDSCQPHGRLTDEQFKDLWLDTEEAFYIPLSLQETQEEVEIPEFGDPEEIPDEEAHYRAGHWISGDMVESLEPVKKVARRVIHMAKATFLSRTRIQSRRGGYLTMIQWDSLFGGDAPEAVKTAPSGVHPLAPLLGVKRVSAKIVTGLRLAGYRVEDVIPEGYRRRVTCLIVP